MSRRDRMRTVAHAAEEGGGRLWRSPLAVAFGARADGVIERWTSAGLHAAWTHGGLQNIRPLGRRMCRARHGLTAPAAVQKRVRCSRYKLT